MEQVQIQNISERKKIALQEYAKCGLDCVYFLKKYAVIQHPLKGKIPFALYGFQEDTLTNEIMKHRYNIILKSRQLGLSTLTAGYCLWIMLFHDDKNILVIAKDKDTAKNLVTKVRVMYDELPSWLKNKTVENNKLSLRFENGSQIKAVAATPDAGRSEALSLLIMDEAAFIECSEEIWAAAQQTLATGGDCIVLSTPNGVGNWFHRMYDNALNGRKVIETDVDTDEGSKDIFNPIRLPWIVHPERDEKWRKEQDEKLGVRLAKQECFGGDTKIYTDKGLVDIKNIKVGDIVLTHTGKFKKVKRLYEKETKQVSEIYSYLNRIKRVVTNTHPFFTPENDRMWSELNNIEDGSLLPSFPLHCHWKDKKYKLNLFDIISPKYFEKVEDGDMFYINDKRHKKRYPKIIEIDYDLGFVIGLYLAEGSKSRLATTFSFNFKTEINTWVQDIIKIIFDKLNIAHYNIRGKNSSANITFNSEILSLLIDYYVDGNKSWIKKLTVDAYESNVEFLKGILDGVFRGDGCLTNSSNKAINLTSLDLLYDIKYLLNILKINKNSLRLSRDGGWREMMGGFVDNKPQYSIKIYQSKHIETEKISDLNFINNMEVRKSYLHRYKIDEDYIYSKLFKKNIDKKITVYNIEVEEDNSYVTEHFIVHNCDADFLSSGNTVIDPEILITYKDNIKEPRWKEGIESAIWIWKRAQEYPIETSFIVTVDTARGDGGDKSAIEVFTEEGEQCAEYNGKLPPKDLANMAVRIGYEYNQAMLVVEVQNVGHTTVSYIKDYNYTNIYYSLRGEDKFLLNEEAMVLKGMDLVKQEDMIAGFNTTPKKRPLMISKMEEMVRNFAPVIYSQRLKSELDVFIWDGRKARAMSGFNDDLVICLAIYFWSRETIFRLKTFGQELSKATLNNWSSQRTEYSVVQNATDRYNNINASNQWSMQMGNAANEQQESISWLANNPNIEKKMAELNRLYTANGKQIPQNILDRLGIKTKSEESTIKYSGVYKK